MPLNDILACEEVCLAEPNCVVFVVISASYRMLPGRCVGRGFSDIYDVWEPAVGFIAGVREWNCSGKLMVLFFTILSTILIISRHCIHTFLK